MRALVTGADGFVGQWLVRALLDESATVTGIIRGETPTLTTLEPATAARVGWRRCDLADAQTLRSLVRESEPNAVFHLAAQSSVPEGQRDPLTTIETNVLGTVRLLESVHKDARDAAVVVVGSSDAYGTVKETELPLSEDAPLRPNNAYAASKAAAEIVALQFARSGFVRAVATRSFNHTGPGQSPTFAVSSFAKQIAAAKHRGGSQEIVVGDLSPRRDICDVRDVAAAYVGLARSGKVGHVYNVCSGKDLSMREVVDELARIAAVDVQIRRDPKLLRPVDTPRLRGDPARIAADTGWHASIPLTTTLSDLLEFYTRELA
ncbi:MAG: GDP-mannose 4,6-dehydratase [Candidatus Eremiobacteraeota bacterium]|nr:GDP-mannose 4,6-dehydratase [Candidatus Eremiobacteraeota bacterium]MBV8264398.1 GDP-mannose 4,6-dehydratase [Candidatus Eremiobacteraeota bacterium]MBV8667894.1 GDP-mannose 4,6-dehydratase [Candidatus Eremiobacteraeota bacterium]